MTITIDGTTGIAGVDGSAATPAAQGTDTNTGIFYGTDIVAVSTGGTERLRVDNVGDVGIGNTNPTAKLDVAGTIRATNTTVPTSGAGIELLYNSSNGTGYVASYDRSGSAFKDLQFQAAAVAFSAATSVTVNAVAGLGYGTGSGGTVTQATNKTTAVTLNKPTGQITTNNAALASNTTVAFLVNNSTVGITDTITFSFISGFANSSSYLIWCQSVAGGFYVLLRNISAGSLSEAIVFQFNVIKGATA